MPPLPVKGGFEVGLGTKRVVIWMILSLAVWGVGLRKESTPAAPSEGSSRVLFLEIFQAATLEEARALRAGSHGRYLGAVQEEDLRREFREAIRDLSDGQWSEPISWERGYVVIRLLTPQEAAARRFPKGTPRYYVELGWAYGERAQYEKEIEAYRKALDLDPNLAEAYVNLGEALRRKALARQKEEREEAAREAEELLDEAIEAFKVALRLNPRLPEAHYNLALAYVAQDLPGLAVIELEEAIRLRPQETAFHKGLASALILDGQCNRAAEEIKKVRKMGVRMEAVLHLWEKQCLSLKPKESVLQGRDGDK